MGRLFFLGFDQEHSVPRDTWKQLFKIRFADQKTPLQNGVLQNTDRTKVDLLIVEGIRKPLPDVATQMQCP